MSGITLNSRVPCAIRDFWDQRVIEEYERNSYAQAFESAFLVINKATIEKCRELGYPEPKFSFRNAVEWLLKKKVIAPRSNPEFPGELWSVAVDARNHFSHPENRQLPMILNQALCDASLPTLADMINELWPPQVAKSN